MTTNTFPIRSNKHIILASQSPRRQQLLAQAEIPFSVLVAHADERFPPDMPIAEAPAYIAAQKADAVWKRLDAAQKASSLVIAADTVVLLGDRLIGKPRHEQEAIQFLRDLSGQTHRVVSGVVLQDEQSRRQFSEETQVRFKKLSEAEIIHYVTRYQPFDKAGAYAIQEWIGIIGVSEIRGDYYNIMGLPVQRLVQELASFSPVG